MRGLSNENDITYDRLKQLEKKNNKSRAIGDDIEDCRMVVVKNGKR